MNFEKCIDILNDRQSRHEHGTEKGSASRAHAACPCLTALTTEHVSNVNTVTEGDTVAEKLAAYEDLSALELLEKFFRLQEERVMVYKEFDTSLAAIIEEGRIAEYSLLCAEITARFQIISKLIITVQNIFLSREHGTSETCGGTIPTTTTSKSTPTSTNTNACQSLSHIQMQTQIGSCIKRLQRLEGEKLILVAAQHMDCIRTHYPAFATHMGGTVGGRGGDVGEDGESSTAAAIAANAAYNMKKKLECEEQIREEMENIMSEKCDLLG